MGAGATRALGGRDVVPEVHPAGIHGEARARTGGTRNDTTRTARGPGVEPRGHSNLATGAGYGGSTEAAGMVAAAAASAATASTHSLAAETYVLAYVPVKGKWPSHGRTGM